MNSRAIRLIVAVLLVVGAMALFLRARALSQAETTARPNVVFILLDALRADRIGAGRAGVAVMPFLNRFAAEGVYYPTAISPCTWTKPAMTSIFTGLDVDAHRVYLSTDVNAAGQAVDVPPEIREQLKALGYAGDDSGPAAAVDPLPGSLLTMAEWLRNAGYTTLGIQTNGNLTKELGFNRGFDVYEYYPDPPGKDVTDRALAVTRETKGPFFLYAHYMDTHLPFAAPENVRAMFPAVEGLTEADRQALAKQLDYAIDRVNWKTGVSKTRSFSDLTPAGVEELRALYDAEARFLDGEAQRLIESIRTQWPNTVFVVVADHGEELMDHDGLGHGVTMYEEVLAVPLIVAGPGIAPKRVEQRQSTLHILPTLARLLGIPPSPQWQGTVDLLAENAKHAPAVARTLAPWRSLNVDLAAMVDGSLKLVIDHGARVQLFDVAADPAERKDLATERADATESLLQQLKARREEDSALAEKLGLIRR